MESQQEEASFLSENQAANRRKAMKRLSCRKCEGHGFYAILKGHAPVCPFNECACETCSAVMNMRANALIRRFRHRKPDHSNALLKTIRSKNGNMRLRILPKTEDSVHDGVSTEVHYAENGGRAIRSGSVTSTLSSVGSATSASSTPASSIVSSGSSSPDLAPSPPLSIKIPQTQVLGDALTEYMQQLLLSQLALNQMQLPPFLGTNAFSQLSPTQQPFVLSQLTPSISTELLYQQLLLAQLQVQQSQVLAI